MYTDHLIPLCQRECRVMLCVLYGSKRRPLCHRARKTFKNRMMEGDELCVWSTCLQFLVAFQTIFFVTPLRYYFFFMFECTSLIPTQTCSKHILGESVCVRKNRAMQSIHEEKKRKLLMLRHLRVVEKI